MHLSCAYIYLFLPETEHLKELDNFYQIYSEYEIALLISSR